jgi:hypothetical protein
MKPLVAVVVVCVGLFLQGALSLSPPTPPSIFMSRLRFLTKCSSSTSVVLWPFLANAAIPTYQEEYGIGSGAMVKSGRLGSTPSLGPTSPVMGIDSPIFFEAMESELRAMEELIKGEKWEAVIQAVKRPPLVLLKSQGGWPSKAAARREDAAVALDMLRDLALENRVIFFNSVDLDAINRLRIEERGPSSNADLTEALDLVKDLRMHTLALASLFS